jgi:hypothetical protein
VSARQPPQRLLFIPHVIYEHGETSWNDVNRGKLFCPSLSILPAEHLVANQEDLSKGNDGFCLQNIYFILAELFNMP